MKLTATAHSKTSVVRSIDTKEPYCSRVFRPSASATNESLGQNHPNCRSSLRPALTPDSKTISLYPYEHCRGFFSERNSRMPSRPKWKGMAEIRQAFVQNLGMMCPSSFAPRRITRKLFANFQKPWTRSRFSWGNTKCCAHISGPEQTPLGAHVNVVYTSSRLMTRPARMDDHPWIRARSVDRLWPAQRIAVFGTKRQVVMANERLAAGLRSLSRNGTFLETRTEPQTLGRNAERIAMMPQRAPVLEVSRLRAWAKVFRPEVTRAALMAVWQISLFLIIGTILHRTHVLDIYTVQGLSKAVYYIFLPALCFVNISAEAASGRHVAMMILFLAAAVHIAIGVIAGELLAYFMNAPKRARRFIRIACGFGNSTALPALFYNSIFATDPSRASSCLGLMSIYCIIWTAAFWPYLHANFGPSNGNENENKPEHGAQSETPQVNHRSVVVKKSAGENNALLQSSMLLLAARRIEPVLHALGTPPAFASILGLLVGLFRPLRSLLYANDQILSLGLLRTLKTLAAANGACALLVLAASLANKTPNDRDRRFKNSMESDSSSVSNRSGRESHRVLAIVLSLHHRVWRLLRSADLSLLVPILITRCVLLPLVSLTIVFPVANRFDLLPHGLTGQLVRFVVLLQGSMPPAQNIVVGLQLDGNHNEAAYAGRQLLVAYLISLVPLSILLTFFLGILNI